MDKLAETVVERHLTEKVIDQLVDTFLDGFNSAKPFSDKDVEAGLGQAGVKPEHLKSVDTSDGEKVASLGGWISKGLWWLLVRPFKVLRDFAKTPKFRAEVYKAFTKELTSGHNVRATKHMINTLTYWIGGQEVKPEELKSALKQLAKVLAGVVAAVIVANPMAGALSAGVWGALSNVVPAVANIVLMVISKPLNVAMMKLVTHYPRD